ncbi:MAG: NAD-dependent deacetylase [Actinomycetia bacterium]|nr:NAD-dependent deacetylase [Actinomycetes bacterium]MCP3910356.1 NAD-dependent deacetylase [Actinomycetes bacterium]MCP4085375.1 NAD-dependent deacetylase [Actinomycetes bacterium]
MVDEAERVLVLTGAGISTDSRIPDFRGPNGVWTRNPGAEKKATLQNYVADPEVRRQSWLNRLDSPIWQAEPNTGHVALLALEQRKKLHTLITQNVDGLHQAAGSDPERIIEVHGTVHKWKCLGCEAAGPIREALDRVRSGEDDPPCEYCGDMIKTATISFGQSLVHDDLVRAEVAAHACDLLLAVGSTLGVYPVAAVVPAAKRNGARVVIVNGEPTEMDDIADALVRASISEVLPKITGAAGR